MPIPVTVLRAHRQPEAEALPVLVLLEPLKRHAVVLCLRRVVHHLKLTFEYVALGVDVNVEPERDLAEHRVRRRGIDAATAGELCDRARLLFTAAPEHRPIGRADGGWWTL